MCSACRRDWRADAALEAFDPAADAMDAKRHARERAERAAAGIPEPTIAELGRALGEAAIPKDRQCTYTDCEHEAVNGHVCVRHEERIA